MRQNGIRKQAMILAGWALDENIHDKKTTVLNCMIKHLHTDSAGGEGVIITLQEGQLSDVQQRGDYAIVAITKTWGTSCKRARTFFPKCGFVLYEQV
ncbi:hypothetical protein GCM10020331_062380 [Ectobacillus funiculus]